MAHPLRLLEVVNSTVEKHGSFEDFFIGLADGARDRGWRLGFVFPRIGTAAVRDRLEATGAETHALEENWSSARGAVGLIGVIRRFRPDVVNFHFCASLHYLAVFAYCMLTGRKVVFHYHGEIRPLESLRWKNRHLSIFRLASLLWTRIVTVSEANRRYLEALRVRAPITVIYNGVDTAMFLDRAAASAPAEARAEARRSFNLCYIGSLIPRKRVDDLLRAFARVAAAQPEAYLTIVGGGRL